MNGIRIRFETKPGKVARLRRRLAEILRELDDRARRLVGGLEAADHLDELQHGHRIEEVHADHALRPRRDRAERGDRDRRRVRREHRARRQHLVRAAEDLFLDRASSTTASIIRSAGTSSSTGSIRAEHPVRIGAALLRELRRALLRIASSPRSTAPGAASCSETRRPDAATTCAIPPPIWPAPTTRTCSNAIAGQAIVARSAARRCERCTLWVEEEGAARPCCSCTAVSATRVSGNRRRMRSPAASADPLRPSVLGPLRVARRGVLARSTTSSACSTRSASSVQPLVGLSLGGRARARRRARASRTASGRSRTSLPA